MSYPYCILLLGNFHFIKVLRVCTLRKGPPSMFLEFNNSSNFFKYITENSQSPPIIEHLQAQVSKTVNLDRIFFRNITVVAKYTSFKITFLIVIFCDIEQIIANFGEHMTTDHMTVWCQAYENWNNAKNNNRKLRWKLAQ